MAGLKKSENSKHNYQAELEKILSSISDTSSENTEDSFSSGKKPTLCLHACCGPCSSYVLEYLANHFEITVLYYNPNIYPEAEYERRLAELKDLYRHFPPVLENHVKFVELSYNPDAFYNAVNTKNEPDLADEPEKGERCRRCYEFRLKCTYNYAKKHSFDYFCTTLSISPFKDAEKINQIGMELAGDFDTAQSPDGLPRCARNDSERALSLSKCTSPDEKNPKWLPSDFKKKGGFKRSLEISEEYSLYRQNYCGCVYSARNK